MEEGEGGEGWRGNVGRLVLFLPHTPIGDLSSSYQMHLEAHSRPHISCQLRNKLGTSPPPTPLPSFIRQRSRGYASCFPISSGPFLNPHSLFVDELPSPFPFPMISTSIPKGNLCWCVGGRLGSAAVRSDLGDIRRGNKRRRAPAASLAKSNVA